MSVTTQTGFTNDAFDAFLAERDEPAWLHDLRADGLAAVRATLPMPGQRDEEWMRTDIRLFRLDKFALPGDEPPAAAAPDGLLTHGVELGGRTVAARQPSAFRRSWPPSGPSRACCSAASTSWCAEHGDLVRKHLFARVRSGLRQVRRAARRLLVAAARCCTCPAAWCIDEPLHMLSALSTGGESIWATPW